MIALAGSEPGGGGDASATSDESVECAVCANVSWAVSGPSCLLVRKLERQRRSAARHPLRNEMPKVVVLSPRVEEAVADESDELVRLLRQRVAVASTRADRGE